LCDVNLQQSILLIDAVIVERACVWQGSTLTPTMKTKRNGLAAAMYLEAGHKFAQGF